MGQLRTVGKVHTTINRGDGVTTITYHDTAVGEFTNDTIWLNTGGWITVTTKTRMNQAANQFDLGYSVFQKKGEWFIAVRGAEDYMKFTQGILQRK